MEITIQTSKKNEVQTLQTHYDGDLTLTFDNRPFKVSELHIEQKSPRVRQATATFKEVV